MAGLVHKHGFAKEAEKHLHELQEKDDPTEEDLDEELAAAKQAAIALTKSGRLLSRSFGFRSKKAMLPAREQQDAEAEAAPKPHE